MVFCLHYFIKMLILFMIFVSMIYFYSFVVLMNGMIEDNVSINSCLFVCVNQVYRKFQY